MSNLGGNILSYNGSEDAYYIQHGADSVPKKLGSGTLKKVLLGTNIGTYNVSSYSDYKNFTDDNFSVEAISTTFNYVNLNQNAIKRTVNVVKSYNSDTGVITITGLPKMSYFSAYSEVKLNIILYYIE